MTLIRRVVRSDFFAINLTPEEARPGTEPLRRVLEFLSTLSVITAVIYGNTRTPESQVAENMPENRATCTSMKLYETEIAIPENNLLKKKKTSPSKINETVQTR